MAMLSVEMLQRFCVLLFFAANSESGIEGFGVYAVRNTNQGSKALTDFSLCFQGCIVQRLRSFCLKGLRTAGRIFFTGKEWQRAGRECKRFRLNLLTGAAGWAFIRNTR